MPDARQPHRPPGQVGAQAGHIGQQEPALGGEFAIELRWVAFPLHPEIPPEGVTLEKLFEGRGIDIPTVNTLIVDRADTLGLAQLYQLRGRVGRSSHRAHAYLLVPGRRVLTVDPPYLGSLWRDAGFARAARDARATGVAAGYDEVDYGLSAMLLRAARSAGVTITTPGSFMSPSLPVRARLDRRR